MIQHNLIHQFLFWGKITGAAMAFVSVITFLYQKLVAPVVRKVVHISSTIDKLDTNCIPTLQHSLDSQDVVLSDLKAGHVRLGDQMIRFGERQDGVEKSVGLLHTSLMNHLENTSREKRKKARG
jgi:hypothetical protein